MSRRVGPVLATVLVAGNMIGSGLYLLPASLAAIGSSSIIGWAIAAAGALLLAGVFAVLAILRPTVDGVVAYAGEGLHPMFGFMSWLAYWLTCWFGNVAIALAVVGYLGFFLPAAAAPPGIFIATLAVIWLITGANLFGARLVGRAGSVGLVVGLLPVALAIGLGLAAFDPALFAASWNPGGKPMSQAIPASVVLIFWAFLGLESANIAAAVVENPRRNLPIAALGGTALAAIVYALATVALMGAIPADTLARSTAPFADAVARLTGPVAGAIVAACAMVKAAATLAGWILVMAETSRSGAAAGYLPSRLSTVDPNRIPTRDILLSAVITSAVAAATLSPTLGRQFNALINASVVLSMAVYALCALALWRFAGAIASRSWRRGVRLAAVLGVAFSVWVIAVSGLATAALALAILAAAPPLWLLSRRLRSRPG